MSIESKKAQKAEKIIRAAEQIFAEKGFHKATVDEIAEVAKVAKGTVYLYFPDKQALFEQILNDQLEEYKKAYDEMLNMDDVEEALRQYVETHLRVYSENAQLVHIHLQNIIDEETKHILLRMHRYHLETAESIVKKGTQQGLFKCEDAFAASIALNGMINQFVLYNLLKSTNIDRKKVAATILELLYKGIMG